MKNVFKKVHLSDKKKLFKRIIEDRLVCLVKTESFDVQQVVPNRMMDEKIVECEFVDGQVFDLKTPEMGVVSINSGEDRYFFYGLVALNNDRVYIETHGDLFYLQRRKSARLELPENYTATARITDFNGKTLPFDCDVADISSGGCKLYLTSLEPLIQPGTILKMKITLGHRSPFEINGSVRHVKPVRDFSELPQTMGIQFVSTDPMFEGRMLNLYMDVQREVFLKYVKR
ncbi:MAG: hypothetical protein B7Y39_05320 [Bdellovibrio sp. 28-41-41]|nr:MAG: hypothetical protein B7Y39_05320 [Bdellovibrio sp. 28-41-41]